MAKEFSLDWWYRKCTKRVEEKVDENRMLQFMRMNEGSGSIIRREENKELFEILESIMNSLEKIRK